MENFKRYGCKICGYIYDPAEGDMSDGIKPGIKWEDLPVDWVCPVCAAKPVDFVPLKSNMRVSNN